MNSNITKMHIIEQHLLRSKNVENDMFQCGKCKTIFDSIQDFLSHKATHLESIPKFVDNITELPSKAITVDKIEIPTKDLNVEVTVANICVDNKASDQHNKLNVYNNSIPEIAPTNANKELFKCGICNNFNSFKRSNFEQHMRTHFNEKPFKCEVCNRSFVQKSQLKTHLNIHKVWPLSKTNKLPCSYLANEGSYSCDYCRLVFNSYTKIRSHIIVNHRILKQFLCPKCNFIFKEEDIFIKHYSNCLSLNKTFKCSVCDLDLKTSDDMKFHNLEHTKCSTTNVCKNGISVLGNIVPMEQDYKCLICMQKFNTKDHLQKHIIYEKHNHVCTFCNKKFNTETKLRHHLLIHKEIHPFNCSLCNKSFNLSHHLKSHMLTHSDEKKFSCQECGTLFKRRDHLMRHIKIHTSIKIIKCPFPKCARQFYRQDKLKLHLRIHTNIEDGKTNARHKKKDSEYVKMQDKNK